MKSLPHVLIGLVLAAILLFGVENYRAAYAPDRSMLPVAFEHGDHTDTICTECHHDYIDDSGGGLCYSCHKQSVEIAVNMESMFHDFCYGCHVTKRHESEDSGPQRECGGCHSRHGETGSLLR